MPHISEYTFILFPLSLSGRKGEGRSLRFSLPRPGMWLPIQIAKLSTLSPGLSRPNLETRTFGVVLLDALAAALASKMATSIEIPLRDTEDEVQNPLDFFMN